MHLLFEDGIKGVDSILSLEGCLWRGNFFLVKLDITLRKMRSTTKYI